MCYKIGDLAVIPTQRRPTFVFRSRMKHNATGSIVGRVAYCFALWAARIYLKNGEVGRLEPTLRGSEARQALRRFIRPPLERRRVAPSPRDVPTQKKQSSGRRE